MKRRVTAGSRQRGQSMVELALVLPLLMLILLGIVDLGRVFNAYIAITNASREGALYGSFYPPVDNTAKDNIKARVLQEAKPTVILNPALVFVESQGVVAGSPVTVTVEYPFSAVSMLMEGFFPVNPFYLKASTVMMVRE